MNRYIELGGAQTLNHYGQLDRSELEAISSYTDGEAPDATRSQQPSPCTHWTSLHCNDTIMEWEHNRYGHGQNHSILHASFLISQNRLPVTTTIFDETVPTIDLRRTEHDADREGMHDALTHYDASPSPHLKYRATLGTSGPTVCEFRLAFATTHGMTDKGACAEAKGEGWRGSGEKSRRTISTSQSKECLSDVSCQRRKNCPTRAVLA